MVAENRLISTTGKNGIIPPYARKAQRSRNNDPNRTGPPPGRANDPPNEKGGIFQAGKRNLDEGTLVAKSLQRKISLSAYHFLECLWELYHDQGWTSEQWTHIRSTINPKSE